MADRMHARTTCFFSAFRFQARRLLRGQIGGVFFLTMLCQFPQVAFADDAQTCANPLLESIRGKIGLNPEARIRAATCALWMNDQLVAIAYEPVGYSPNDNLAVWLGLLNPQNGNLKSWHEMRVPDGGGEMVTADSLRFDTRKLVLRKGVYGFGFKITQHLTVRCGEGGSDGQLMLFHPRGKRLVPLFGEPLTTHYYRYVEGTACIEPSRVEEIYLEVALGETSHKGMRDLLLKVNQTGRAPRADILRWNGSRYPVEKTNQALISF